MDVIVVFLACARFHAVLLTCCEPSGGLTGDIFSRLEGGLARRAERAVPLGRVMFESDGTSQSCWRTAHKRASFQNLILYTHRYTHADTHTHIYIGLYVDSAETCGRTVF